MPSEQPLTCAVHEQPVLGALFVLAAVLFVAWSSFLLASCRQTIPKRFALWLLQAVGML